MSEPRPSAAAGLLTVLLAIIAIPGAHVVYALATPNGPQQLAANVDSELALLSVTSRGIGEVLQAAMQAAYQMVYQGTGLAQAVEGGAEVNYWIARSFRFIEALTVSAQLIALRVTVLTFCIPFIGVSLFVAFVDGWVGWSLRRASGARESAFLYHRAKRMGLGAPLLIVLLYLMSPFPVHPMLALAPILFTAAIGIWASMRFFKKHI